MEKYCERSVDMLTNERLRNLFSSVMQFMGGLNSPNGPRPLYKVLKSMAEMAGQTFTEKEYETILAKVAGRDPNNFFFLAISKSFREWDASTNITWCSETQPLSIDRRAMVYSLLELPDQVIQFLNEKIPPYKPDGHPVIIADEHDEWYTKERQIKHNFYWKAYGNYLATHGNWPTESIIALDEASDKIVERLSDPEREEIYSTKGLVVGYVQSGKTANFTAVTAKAADAGYRLIIVIAGTLNILREQTQRRFDKELVGSELISDNHTDHDYFDSKDWNEFISHGGFPSDLGSFDWRRLTGEKDDYQRLKRGLEAFEFKGVNPGRRFNDPASLHVSPAVLIVVKKIPSVLKKLNDDLSRLKTHLEEVPVLIIDDESDQASVNTTKPNLNEEKKRTATNAQIIKLVNMLPRAQYIGYTATPFANVFINPTDAEDLFPKDYIVSLPRPKDYMGIYDFFDFGPNCSELDESDPTPKEDAYIRNVIGDDENENNLVNAIKAFIISGAIKLYRKNHGVDLSDKHHTMLIHRSVQQISHEEDANLVRNLYEKLKPGSGLFYTTLKKLWDDDFKLVIKSLSLYDCSPTSFNELLPFIDECISLIEKEGKEIRIINGDKNYRDNLPNFDKDRIWSILVGGTKLSRGYTVEGLTISYYRRRIKQADTLMQVGRWFGFRRGYMDLVRLYVGREEEDARGNPIDLYESFKSICRDEEVFRKELERYSSPDNNPRILPIHIPPLVPSHLLLPTAPNKMWHTDIIHKNFGGAWKESGRPKNSNKARKNNATIFRELLKQSDALSNKKFCFQDSNAWSGIVWEANVEKLLWFMEQYQWDKDNLMKREIEFMKGKDDKDPMISNCLIICPQKAKPSSYTWSEMSVFERCIIEGGGFKVFSESRHVRIAEAIALKQTLPSSTKDLTDLTRSKTAVIVAYPTIGTGVKYNKSELDDKDVTIGFGIKFPQNDIKTPLTFGVVS
jgi:hypothetical protein